MTNDCIGDESKNCPIFAILCFMMIDARNIGDDHLFEEKGPNGEHALERHVLERCQRFFRPLLKSKNFYCLVLWPFVGHFEQTVRSVPLCYQRVVFAELPFVLVLVYLIENFFQWRQLNELNNETDRIISHKGILIL